MFLKAIGIFTGRCYVVKTAVYQVLVNRINDMKTAIEGLTGQHEDYIAAPMGGTTIDVEARSAINDIINALVTSGIINPQ